MCIGNVSIADLMQYREAEQVQIFAWIATRVMIMWCIQRNRKEGIVGG